MSHLMTYLQKILNKEVLSKAEAAEALESILNGASGEETASLLTLLHCRGEKESEIAGMLDVIEKKSILHTTQLPYPVLDIVGTGGDFANTVNISTGAAILTAACGVPVVKHGNRASSSLCGSADVLEVLGINIALPLSSLKVCLKQINIAFFYAPLFHPSLKAVKTIREKMKIPTIFNLLGPLLNPVKAEYLLIGVAQEKNLEVMSKVIMQIKRIKRALIVHGCGLDELTTIGKMKAYEINHGKRTKIEIDPTLLGFKNSSMQDLKGGNPEKNAYFLIKAFKGEKRAIADAFILNAAAALKIFGKASSLTQGIELARTTLYQGKALALIEKWRTLSNNEEALNNG